MSYSRTRPAAGPIEGAIHGAAIYLGLTIGLFLSTTLSLFLGGDDSVLVSTTPSDKLYTAATFGLDQLLVVGPLLAAGLSVYYLASDRGEPAFVPAAVGTVVGTVLSGLLLLVLAVFLAPAGVDIKVAAELPVLLAITTGSVLTAVISGIGLDLA